MLGCSPFARDLLENLGVPKTFSMRLFVTLKDTISDKKSLRQIPSRQVASVEIPYEDACHVDACVDEDVFEHDAFVVVRVATIYA